MMKKVPSMSSTANFSLGYHFYLCICNGMHNNNNSHTVQVCLVPIYLEPVTLAAWNYQNSME